MLLQPHLTITPTSIKTLLEEGTNSTLSKDITFDGVLKQFKARSPKGWQHFDIIHGHSGGPITLLGYEFAKLKRIPYVFTYHTLFNQYTHYFLKGKVITPKMAETASRILCNRFDYIVAPTQRIMDELVSYGVKKPNRDLYLGLSSSFPVQHRRYAQEKMASPT